MKRALYKLFILLLLPLAQLSAQETKLKEVLYNFHHDYSKVMVAAHRGAHQSYPENSIASFHEAIRLGVDIVELDVRNTKDGKLVVIHDKTIDRTTTGKGEVKDYTLLQLQELQLLHNGKITDEKIPTLEEALQVMKGKIMIDLDYKADKEFVQKTINTIEEAAMLHQVLFFVYDYKEIPTLQKISDSILFMPRAYNAKEMKNVLKEKNIPVVHIDESYYKDGLMKKYSSQTRIWANALGKYDKIENKTEAFDFLFKHLKYANIIQTDYPEELISYLRQKGVDELAKIEASILVEEMIYNKADFPKCHASSIVETEEGLLATWFGGTDEGYADVCIYTAHKPRDGKWSSPKLVADGIQNDKLRFPCWNPVLFHTGTKTILYYKVGESPSKWWGEYKTSTDNGKTWSAKKEIPRTCLGIKNK